MKTDNHVFLVQSKPGIWERAIYGSLFEMQQYSSAYNTEGYAEGYYDTLNPPSAERAKERSKTFDGIANAMADQWG